MNWPICGLLRLQYCKILTVVYIIYMLLNLSTCLTIFSDLVKYISLQYGVLPWVLGFLSSTFIVLLRKSITFAVLKKTTWNQCQVRMNRQPNWRRSKVKFFEGRPIQLSQLQSISPKHQWYTCRSTLIACRVTMVAVKLKRQWLLYTTLLYEKFWRLIA